MKDSEKTSSRRCHLNEGINANKELALGKVQTLKKGFLYSRVERKLIYCSRVSKEELR
jgi:hypothetical protein